MRYCNGTNSNQRLSMKGYMMLSNLLLFLLTCSCGNVSVVGADNALVLKLKKSLLNVQKDEDIKKEALRIFQEADKLFQLSNDRLDKFLNGSYERDGLTLKDFIWSFKSMADGMNCNIIRPLAKLRATVADDAALDKALAITQSVATELYTSVSYLCKALHPYERTKKRADAYKVAKVLKTTIEKFLTQDRFDKYKKNLEEVIELLRTKSVLNYLVENLCNLNDALVAVGNTTTKIDELKVLNRIMNRISHN